MFQHGVDVSGAPLPEEPSFEGKSTKRLCRNLGLETSIQPEVGERTLKIGSHPLL